MTLDEYKAVADRYSLKVYEFPGGMTYVVSPTGNLIELCNLDLDTMTPDEFESLVLPLVLEGAFCS